MSKVKKQHYVPRCYLEQFAHQELRAYDRWSDNSFAAKPEKIAVEHYFYDIAKTLDTNSPYFQVFEKMLASLESSYKTTYNALLQGRTIESPEKEYLACFIAMQYLRTPRTRAQLCEHGAKTVEYLAKKHLLSKGYSPEEIEKSGIEVSFKKDGKTRMQLNAMFGKAYRTTVEALLRHSWLLLCNKTGVPFLTSDAPVVLFNELKGGLLGFSSPGIKVIFPLSPKYCLLIQELSKEPLAGDLDGKCIPAKPADVTKYNELQIRNSFRFVYYSDAYFNSIGALCNEFPELRRASQHKLEIIENKKTGEVTFRALG